MEVLQVHKMYFYVNSSCEEANLNKFGFCQVMRLALYWPFLIECLAFFSNFKWPFLLKVWRFEKINLGTLVLG